MYRPGSVPVAPTSAQEGKKSGCQPLQIDGCGGQIGLNAHVREAAPDSAGKPMPGLCSPWKLSERNDAADRAVDLARPIDHGGVAP